MIELIEILIGVFITSAVMYARYFYGTKAMLELIILFLIGAVLAIFYFTEVMKSVCDEAEESEKTSSKKGGALDTLKKAAATQLLSVSYCMFKKTVELCKDVIEDEEGEDPYEE